MRSDDQKITIELEKQCKDIAQEITESKGDYFTNEEDPFDYYDVVYHCNRDKSYRGAEIMVAGGGPSIYINTCDNKVEGYWGSSEASWYFVDNAGIYEYFEELYDCS